MVVACKDILWRPGRSAARAPLAVVTLFTLFLAGSLGPPALPGPLGEAVGTVQDAACGLSGTPGQPEVQEAVCTVAGLCTPCPSWTARYNGPANDGDAAQDVAVSPDGATVYVTGDSFAGWETTGWDMATFAYDAATGVAQWESRYSGPAKDDGANAVAVHPDGSHVYVTGRSMNVSANEEWATIAYDAQNGDEAWTARHDGPGSGWEEAFHLAVDPGGERLYVAGRSPGAAGEPDVALVAYDAATGTEVWHARDTDELTDFSVNAMAVSPDGTRIHLVGSDLLMEEGGISSDMAAVAYDAATGDVVWSATRDGGEMRPDVAATAVVAPDGDRLHVAGTTHNRNLTADVLVWTLETAAGDTRWTARFDGDLEEDPFEDVDEPHAIGLAPDGDRVYVAGQSADGQDAADLLVLAFDAATGDALWDDRHGTVGQWSVAEDLVVARDGRLFVAGWHDPGDDHAYDYLTLGYDPSGDQTFQASWDGPAQESDTAAAIAAGPDTDQVFVTGRSLGVASHYDFLTLAYDTS